jgi:hypothetical protein
MALHRTLVPDCHMNFPNPFMPLFIQDAYSNILIAWANAISSDF